MATCLLWAGCDDGPRFHGAAVDPPRPAPGISGANWDGSRFDLASLRGRLALVFFGYTFCPDVCPLTMAKLKQVHVRLGPRASEVAVVMVSVDPERDSVEKLADYVGGFSDEFYGVRLDPERLEGVSQAYGVRVDRRSAPAAGGSFYAVDHTGTLFVVDRTGRLRLELAYEANVDEIAADVAVLLDEPVEESEA